MPPISILIKPASSICNMRCTYCFYGDEAAKRTQASYGFMSYETLKNVIRRTLPHAEGSISYAFQGGEPTLRGLDFFREVLRLEQQYNKKGIPIQNSLQTNGYLLDDAWCQFLSVNHFLVGLSVDGIKQTHDLCRRDHDNQPAYDRVIQAAALLDRYHVEYNILTVVTGELSGHIDEIYADYKQKHWLYQQYIACLDPLEETRGTRSYSLLPEQYGQFLIRLFRLWHQDVLSGTAPYIRQFDDYIRILSGHQAMSCDQRGTCSLQNVIEADGSVYPCDFYVTDEYRLGNLNESRFPEILESAPARSFPERSTLLTDACRACRYFQLCRGGCQRNRILSGSSTLYENYFCSAYRMFFDECYEQMKELVSQIRFRS